MHLFPFIEQGNLKPDLIKGIYSSGWQTLNATAVINPIPTMLCPSDPRQASRGPASYYSTPSPYMWRANYAATFSPDGFNYAPDSSINVSSCHKTASNPSFGSNKRSLFNANTNKRMASVTDGTSNTAAFSEMIAGKEGTNDIRGWWSNSWGAAYSHYYTPNATSGDIIMSTEPAYCVAETKLPCSITGPCWTSATMAARSYHTGGVMVGLVDGSVRFVSNNVDPNAWQALGSINGSESSDIP